MNVTLFGNNFASVINIKVRSWKRRLYLLLCDWCPYEKKRNTGLKEEYSEDGSEDWNLGSINQETPEPADTHKT